MGGSDSDSEEDVHQCGRCKEIFKDVEVYFNHKKAKTCKKVKPSAERAEVAPTIITPPAPAALQTPVKEEVIIEDPQEEAEDDTGTEGVGTRTRKRHRRKAAPKKAWVTNYAEDEAEFPDDNYAASDNGSDSNYSDPPPPPPRKRLLPVRKKAKRGRPGRPRKKGPAPAKVRVKKEPPLAPDGTPMKRPRGRPRKDGSAPRPSAYSSMMKEARVKYNRMISSEEDDGPKSPKQPKKKYYKCPQCEYKAFYKDEFDRHLRKEHNLSNFVCSWCKKPFRDRYKMQKHMESSKCKEVGDIMLSCAGDTGDPKAMDIEQEDVDGKAEDPNAEKAVKTEVDDDELATYDTKKIRVQETCQSQIKADIGFNCNECSLEFDSYEKVLEHLKGHPDIFPGICKFCGRWFPSKYKLWRHVLSIVHDDVPDALMDLAKKEIEEMDINWTEDPTKRVRTVNKRIQCPKCPQTFNLTDQFVKHFKIKHAPVSVMKRYQCAECGQGFPKRHNYFLHLHQAHGIEDPEVLENKCLVCLRFFKQKNHVLRHRDSLHTSTQQVSRCYIHEVEGQGWDQEPSTVSTIDFQDMKDAENDEKPPKPERPSKHVCFVCVKILPSFSKYIEHLQGHRIWIPNPVGGSRNMKAETGLGKIPGAEVDFPTTLLPEDFKLNKGGRPKKLPTDVGVVPLPHSQEQRGEETISRDEQAVLNILQEMQDMKEVQRTTLDGTSYLDLMNAPFPANQSAPHPTGIAASHLTNHTPVPSNHSAPHPTNHSAPHPTNHSAPHSTILQQHTQNHLPHHPPHPSNQSAPHPPMTNGQVAQSMQVQPHSHGAMAPYQERGPLFSPATMDLVTEISDAVSTQQKDDADPKPIEIAPIDSGTQQSQPVATSPPSSATALEAEKKDDVDAVPGAIDPKTVTDVDRKWLCPYCLTYLNSMGDMYRHKVDYHNLMPVYQCIKDDCLEIFHKHHEYKEHHQLHPQRAFICLICNIHLDNYDAMVVHKGGAHRLLHAMDTKTRCTACHRVFASPEALQNHVKSDPHHYQCETCSKVFKGKTELNDHMLVHSGIKSFMCDQCGSMFGTRIRLRRHRALHFPTQMHECPMCSAVFHKREHMRRHLGTIHNKEKPYACPFTPCTKAFNRKDKLQAHVKVHSDVMDYICSICGKGYKYREGLRHHEKSHKRENKHFCNQCRMGFVRMVDLRKHMKNEHQIIMRDRQFYPCQICGHQCSRPAKLKRHMEFKHNIRADWKYPCQLCDRGFSGKRGLATHMKKRHKMESDLPGAAGNPPKKRRQRAPTAQKKMPQVQVHPPESVPTAVHTHLRANETPEPMDVRTTHYGAIVGRDTPPYTPQQLHASYPVFPEAAPSPFPPGFLVAMNAAGLNPGTLQPIHHKPTHHVQHPGQMEPPVVSAPPNHHHQVPPPAHSSVSFQHVTNLTQYSHYDGKYY